MAGGGNNVNSTDQEQVTGQEKEGTEGVEHTELSERHDDPPPSVENPFIPIPRVGNTHNTVKEAKKGLGHPQISTTLMDTIVLPKDLT